MQMRHGLKRDDKIYRKRTVRKGACCLDCNKINAQQRFIKEKEKKKICLIILIFGLDEVSIYFNIALHA